MNYRSYEDLNSIIRKNIAKLQSHNFDLIVGIPRSGMIPAYKIAMLLNKHCTDLPSLLENRPLKKGSTRAIKKNISHPAEAKKILLVDDSILTGESMQEALNSIPNEIRRNITILAIYSSRKHRDDVDMYFEFVPFPRIFEWNVFHHNILTESCVDIDGVLCRDPLDKEDDDGENYRDFLANVDPLFLPTTKIHSLVTNRLEKYRTETESWLAKHNVEYNNLIMLNLPNKEERKRAGLHSLHKAEYYKRSGLPFFIESDKNQARNISEIAKKPVYCVDNNQMYRPGAILGVLNNPKNKRVFLLRRFASYLPASVYRTLLPYYRQISGRKAGYKTTF